MNPAGTQSIRSLFSTRRPIDRPIEKVIDYYATDPSRLAAEVEEYEVTKSVERNLVRFLDVVGEGIRGGQVAETGVWVSGFYGSGKSSFTKYLGFALDPAKDVNGTPFLDLFADRIGPVEIKQQLKTLAQREPVAVIMLDLGSEQLASSATEEVSKVLYWKVLQWAGYSRVDKLAQLEFRLERDGLYDEFQRAHGERFGGSWQEIHDDGLIGVRRADQLIPRFYPQEFPEERIFHALRFSLTQDARELARDMLDVVYRRSGKQNVLFLIDEVGQYVAPRGELILNLDGLARNLKELGKGRVWIVATAQQTLTEIVERAAYNSTELFKLQARFPVTIELDARDIREITHLRLLSKSPDGEAALRDLFQRHGSSLASHTRLTGTGLYKGDVDAESFVKFYPFLPQHFDLLLEIVRNLARASGGLGLRSAIRVVQDLLVDASKVLPPGEKTLAGQPVGTLATADSFYDTLRADINKVQPHVVAAIDRIEQAMQGDERAIRAGKAIAVLQLLESFPRTAENVAALLYRSVGDPPHADAVYGAITRLLDTPETGLVDDPQAGGYTYLSDKVKPMRDKRNGYQPTTAELATWRSTILRDLFTPQPTATIEATKTVRAGLRFGRNALLGDDEEIQLQIETTNPGAWDERRTALLTETSGTSREWQHVIAWLIQPSGEIDDALAEVVRSDKAVRETPETEADKDVAQFVRAERRTKEANLDQARKLYHAALMAGTLIFHGKPTPAASAGIDVESAARTQLADAAIQVYPKYHLVNIRPSTDLATKFLAVERLDRMPSGADPLGFVKTTAGKPAVDPHHPALAETRRGLVERLERDDTTRIQGNALQDAFAKAPYGWSKDATRYVLAGLLLAGEIVLFTPAGEVQTPGPAAVEALKNTQAFNKVGIGRRGIGPSLDALMRAADQLSFLIGESVMPLEDRISRAAREKLGSHIDNLADLPAKLRFLDLGGAERAQAVLDTGRALLQGDGSAAVAILGAQDSTFREDLLWAKEAANAFAQGAEREVRQGRTVVREANNLDRLFPHLRLVTDEDRATINDSFGSSRFFERMGDVRQLVRRVFERARATYRSTSDLYATDILATKLRLEAQPAWGRVTDEDRTEIIGRLPDPPTVEPSDEELLFSLNQLLHAHTGLLGTEAELLRMLGERVPKETSDNGGTTIDLSALLPIGPLTDAASLERWLDQLRSVLEQALAVSGSVRLTVHEAERERVTA